MFLPVALARQVEGVLDELGKSAEKLLQSENQVLGHLLLVLHEPVRLTLAVDETPAHSAWVVFIFFFFFFPTKVRFRTEEEGGSKGGIVKKKEESRRGRSQEGAE